MSAEPSSLTTASSLLSIPKDELFSSLACACAVYQERPSEFLRIFGLEILPVQSCSLRVSESSGLTYFYTRFESPNPRFRYVLVVSIRGSACAKDWIDNMKIFALPDSVQGKVHTGFHKRALDFPLAQLIYFLETDATQRIILTGHSQGSAVAELILILLLKSPQFKSEWRDRLSFIGFASPLVGNGSFAESLRPYSDLFHRIINKEDLIPRLLLLASCPQVADALEALIDALIQFLTQDLIPANLLSSFRVIRKFVTTSLVSLILTSYSPNFGRWNFISHDPRSSELKVSNDSDKFFDASQLLEWLPTTSSPEPLQHHTVASYIYSIRTLCKDLPSAGSSTRHVREASLQDFFSADIDCHVSLTKASRRLNVRLFTRNPMLEKWRHTHLEVRFQDKILVATPASLESSSVGSGLNENCQAFHAPDILDTEVEVHLTREGDANRIILKALVQDQETPCPLWILLQSAFFMGLMRTDAESAFIAKTLVEIESCILDMVTQEGGGMHTCARAVAVFRMLGKDAFAQNMYEEIVSSSAPKVYLENQTTWIKNIRSNVESKLSLGQDSAILFSVLTNASDLPSLLGMMDLFQLLHSARQESKQLKATIPPARARPSVIDANFSLLTDKQKLNWEDLKKLNTHTNPLDEAGDPDISFLFTKGIAQLFLLTLTQERSCFLVSRQKSQGFWESLKRLFAIKKQVLAEQSYIQKLFTFYQFFNPGFFEGKTLQEIARVPTLEIENHISQSGVWRKRNASIRSSERSLIGTSFDCFISNGP